MPQATLRIATRRSELARWQAHHVATQLQRHHPDLDLELVEMTTRGDQLLGQPLAQVGGKGLFVKELERGILEGRADIAVHSLKDVPMELPADFALPVVLARADPRDALVVGPGAKGVTALDQLPPGAAVGTCSLRRQCQILARHPELRVLPLRGNVNSRLAKLDAGEFAAVVLAAAGLERLGLGRRIAAVIPDTESLPAIGQGVIAIECRRDDPRTHALIQPLDHAPTHAVIRAERALNARLQGSCQVPLGGYGVLEGDDLWLRGLVGEPDGSHLVTGERRGLREDADGIGKALADDLLRGGAAAILHRLQNLP
ncbi:MAG: hydroxymethylbilane synthase [Candidatus Competibacterales bacterium]